MLKSDTREIGDLKVTVTQLPPRRAFRLAAKLAKYLAPALAGLKADTELSLEALTPALGAMMRELEDDDLDRLLSDLFASTSVIVTDAKGQARKHDLVTPEAIDRAFEGQLKHMLTAMRFSLEVNFGDFFEGPGPSVGTIPAATP